MNNLNKSNKIIQYDNLEVPIVSIEKVLDDYDLEEKSLILKFVMQRINERIRKQKIAQDASDTINSFNMKNVFKMLNKKDGED